VPELQRLHAGHAPAVLAFELANRAYFATLVSDRGDAFFDQFTERYTTLLAEQEAGLCVFHVLAGDDGTLPGRFNLVDLADGTAELGYRVAQQAASRRSRRGDRGRARTVLARGRAVRSAHAQSSDYERQRRVPESAGQGWVRPGWPGPARRRPGTWYERDLAAG
jgi:[ribosomal protein S5]-alanine N-acetyltransferase